MAGRKVNSGFNEDSDDLRWLRRFSDLVCHRLENDPISEAEAVYFLLEARCQIMKRCPDKKGHYMRYYEKRFRNILLKKGVALNIFQDDQFDC